MVNRKGFLQDFTKVYRHQYMVWEHDRLHVQMLLFTTEAEPGEPKRCIFNPSGPSKVNQVKGLYEFHI